MRHAHACWLVSCMVYALHTATHSVTNKHQVAQYSTARFMACMPDHSVPVIYTSPTILHISTCSAVTERTYCSFPSHLCAFPECATLAQVGWWSCNHHHSYGPLCPWCPCGPACDCSACSSSLGMGPAAWGTPSLIGVKPICACSACEQSDRDVDLQPCLLHQVLHCHLPESQADLNNAA